MVMSATSLQDAIDEVAARDPVLAGLAPTSERTPREGRATRVNV